MDARRAGRGPGSIRGDRGGGDPGDCAPRFNPVIRSVCATLAETVLRRQGGRGRRGRAAPRLPRFNNPHGRSSRRTIHWFHRTPTDCGWSSIGDHERKSSPRDDHGPRRSGPLLPTFRIVSHWKALGGMGSRLLSGPWGSQLLARGHGQRTGYRSWIGVGASTSRRRSPSSRANMLRRSPEELGTRKDRPVEGRHANVARGLGCVPFVCHFRGQMT